MATTEAAVSTLITGLRNEIQEREKLLDQLYKLYPRAYAVAGNETKAAELETLAASDETITPQAETKPIERETPVEEAICANCKVTKPLTAFNRVPSCLAGHDPTCKACRTDQAKERREGNRKLREKSAPSEPAKKREYRVRNAGHSKQSLYLGPQRDVKLPKAPASALKFCCDPCHARFMTPEALKAHDAEYHGLAAEEA